MAAASISGVGTPAVAVGTQGSLFPGMGAGAGFPAGSGAGDPVPGVAPPPTAEQVKAAVADANQSLAQNGTQLSFVFDDQLHRMLVKIVDTQTHKVVGQIPSEAMLAAARALAGTSSNGALVNTKV